MAVTIQRVAYFHVTVPDGPGGAYRLLEALARHGINLLAFNMMPAGPNLTQLVLFPEDEALFERTVKSAGVAATGPDHALLVTGDDELGAAAAIHQRLEEAGVEPFAAGGVTDGEGGFGYLVYVRSQEFERAAAALGI